jgi:hypothetical protein
MTKRLICIIAVKMGEILKADIRMRAVIQLNEEVGAVVSVTDIYECWLFHVIFARMSIYLFLNSCFIFIMLSNFYQATTTLQAEKKEEASTNKHVTNRR